MQQLTNKQILLGITGGIAAYKAAELVRRLQDGGAEVRVVMTAAACEFITPLTLQALSGHPVHTDLLDPAAEAAMGHIELARWADLILVAPASADFMARLCHGQGNDLLTTVCLASAAPLVLAPAMNQAMWRQASTQDNVNLLQQRGATLLGPADGEQACGDVGPGRMLEPEQLAQLTAAQFASGLLDGLELTITAGPTREALDPVRFLSNHSSGKMGFALAEAAAEAGAKVTLIAGPVALATPPRVNRIDVESAEQMLAASLQQLGNCQIFIAAAAVADYRPAAAVGQKIKKTGDEINLTLIKNPDIIATVAGHEQRPFCVGFAAETQNLADYARNKLVNKKLDMIIANDVSQSGIGFNSDDNAVTVFTADTETAFEQLSKNQLSRQLLVAIHNHYSKSLQCD